MWILSLPECPELQRESIQGEYCLYLIIPSSKGRAPKVNIVSTWLSRALREEHSKAILSTWLSRASKEEHPRAILSLPDYHELQRKSIQGQYCLYLIIPSSKGRAFKRNIASTWLSRAPREEHLRGILPLTHYPELQGKSIQGENCLYLIIPSSKGRASMEKTDVLLGLTTVGIILSYFSASSPGSSRSQPVPWSNRYIQWDYLKSLRESNSRLPIPESYKSPTEENRKQLNRFISMSCTNITYKLGQFQISNYVFSSLAF